MYPPRGRSIVVAARSRDPCLSLQFVGAYFSIINAISHVIMFFRFRYNPGFFVSLFLNIPVGLFTIYHLTTNNIVSLKVHLIGFTIGVIIQLGLMVYGFLILKPKIV